MSGSEGLHNLVSAHVLAGRGACSAPSRHIRWNLTRLARSPDGPGAKVWGRGGLDCVRESPLLRPPPRSFLVLFLLCSGRWTASMGTFM